MSYANDNDGHLKCSSANKVEQTASTSPRRVSLPKGGREKGPQRDDEVSWAIHNFFFPISILLIKLNYIRNSDDNNIRNQWQKAANEGCGTRTKTGKVVHII